MKRNTTNFLLDGGLLLAGSAIVFTGLLLKYVLPHGSTRQGLMAWGLDRHLWGDIHFWVSLSFIALILLHLALHWTWVCNTGKRLLLKSKSGAMERPTRYIIGGAITLSWIVVLGAGLMLANNSRHTAQADHVVWQDGAGVDGEQADNRKQNKNSVLRGTTTVTEAAQSLDVSPESVLRLLELAENTPTDRSLGQLARGQGRTMREYRQVLEAFSSTPVRTAAQPRRRHSASPSSNKRTGHDHDHY